MVDVFSVCTWRSDRKHIGLGASDRNILGTDDIFSMP